MVRGAFYMVCGTFYMVRGAFYMVRGAFYMVRGAFYMVCGMVRGAFYMVCGAFWGKLNWMSWSSGLVHRICVLIAESSECGFKSWLRPWCLCPSARHFTIIASLHPGVNGYLWGQSWLLCLISPMRRNGSNWAEMVSGINYAPDEQG